MNDTKCIEQVKQIMGTTPGFDIVYDRGAYVLDEIVNDGVYEFSCDGQRVLGTSLEPSTAAS